MNYYFFFIYNQDFISRRGTLTVTTNPETLGERIAKSQVSNAVSALCREAKDQLRIALVDVRPSKIAVPMVKKSLVTTLTNLGFVMSQRARTLTSLHQYMTREMIEQSAQTVDELRSDYPTELKPIR